MLLDSRNWSVVNSWNWGFNGLLELVLVDVVNLEC